MTSAGNIAFGNFVPVKPLPFITSKTAVLLNKSLYHYSYTLIGTAQTQKNRPKLAENLNFPQLLNLKGDILGVLYRTPIT
jgi:hypothetical protein